MVTTLAWAWTGGTDQLGLPLGPVGDPTVALPILSSPESPVRSSPLRGEPRQTSTRDASAPGLVVADVPTASAPVSSSLSSSSSPSSLARLAFAPPQPPGFAAPGRRCYTGRRLVPTCGILWGVAPGAHTESRGASALARFERKTGRSQAIYHAYHGGIRQLFPTPQEIAIARQPGRPRILFLNWKPESASWAAIARGDKRTDAFIDRLAGHVRKNFREQFFLAIHHEGENDVRPRAGSGYTAKDYAAMFRHVVKRLRAKGADNVVTVLVHMAYVPHATQTWFNSMYPGDDVVDWIGFDTYAYSDPGYGHGDFAEILNRRVAGKHGWPGFYDWAVTRHAGKPLMLAEWGVWSSNRDKQYKADFYRRLGADVRRFPKIRAMVQFETPHNQKGQDSSVDSTPQALQAYRKLGRLPIFQVAVTP